MSSWVPAALIEGGELHTFAVGTVVLSDPFGGTAAVSLAVRVTSATGPALYHLTGAGRLKLGHVTRLDRTEPRVGFGIVFRDVSPELEWDITGGTVEPKLTLAGLGCLALGVGGVRLVGAAPKAQAAHYFDPTDWSQRPFSDGHDASILSRRWRLVLPSPPQQRIVLFDASTAG